MTAWLNVIRGVAASKEEDATPHGDHSTVAAAAAAGFEVEVGTVGNDDPRRTSSAILICFAKYIIITHWFAKQ